MATARKKTPKPPAKKNSVILVFVVGKEAHPDQVPLFSGIYTSGIEFGRDLATIRLDNREVWARSYPINSVRVDLLGFDPDLCRRM